MAKHSSPEVRSYACTKISQGYSIQKLAKELKVTEQTIKNWLRSEATKEVRGKNTLPGRLIYSLEEGAAITGITPGELLHYGSLGKVELCIEVPKNAVPIKSSTIEAMCYCIPGPDPFFILKQELDQDRVDYIVISKADCQRIEAVGHVHTAVFKEGYEIYANKELIVKKPDRFRVNKINPDGIHAAKVSLSSKRLSALKHGYHVFKSVNAIKDFELDDLQELTYELLIQQSILFVSAVSLNNLVVREVSRMALHADSSESFVVHKNKSSWLIDLDRAASEIWGDFNPVRAANYKDAEKAASYLVDKYGFYKYVAEHGAMIIIPEDNKNPQNNSDKPYRTAMLQSLINGWEAVCARLDSAKEGYEGGCRELELWLSKNAPSLTQDKLLKSVQQITLPDNVKRQRARNPKS